jgi:hypothetical protein
MLRARLVAAGVWLLLLAAACSDSTAPKPLAPLPACTAGRGFAVSPLAVARYVSVDPGPDSGCVLFPSNLTASAVEYLVIPQSAAGTPGVSAAYSLEGDTIHTAAALAAAAAAPLPVAEQFHDFLREGERTHWYGFVSQSRGEPAGPSPAPPSALLAGPPVVGSSRTFSVCAKLDCSQFKTVTATAKTVLGHIALYVDDAAPANGLNQFDLDTIASTFEGKLYPLDTTAFGRESDIDNNTVVDVLMTNQVNQLVSDTACLKTGFVAGFFFGADLDPAFANDSRVNHGEVFYSIVADSAGTLSCAHSRTLVKRLVPVTFVHEFQHMISFNQHVLLRGGQAEVLWLNEGMSHLAEELGGRSYLPGDSASFVRFTVGDLFNASQYLEDPGAHFLLAGTGIGTLAERGSAWLFVRYITDQFRADTSFAATAAFTRKIDGTTLTGAENVTTQTGVAFDTLVARWAIALWVSDLPGFTAPPELKYTSWNFRSTFASLHTSFPSSFPSAYPLSPTSSAGNLTSLTGTLRAGSGAYHRALQNAGDLGFQLRFAGQSRILFDQYRSLLPVAIVPRLTIIRIR